MAKIKLNNNEYPISDSTLAPITADFVAHLGTIAGNGMKVVVGGVEYGVDSSKVAGAWMELREALEGLTVIIGKLVEFDGDLTGKEHYNMGGDSQLVKMTDKLLTQDELVGSTIVCGEADMYSGEKIEITAEMVMSQPISETGFMIGAATNKGDVLVMVLTEPFQGIPKGTFFVYHGYTNNGETICNYYVKSISCLTE